MRDTLSTDATRADRARDELCRDRPSLAALPWRVVNRRPPVNDGADRYLLPASGAVRGWEWGMHAPTRTLPGHAGAYLYLWPEVKP